MALIWSEVVQNIYIYIYTFFFFFFFLSIFWDFSGSSVVKNLPANVGDVGLIPSLGRPHMAQSGWAHVPQLLSLCCSRPWEP